MQNNFFKNFLQIIFRGVLTGVVALAVFLGGVYAVSANTGGKFGEILDKILVSGNWTQSDGTVKNAQKLGGIDASNYQKISSQTQRCEPNKCIVGFKESGEIICQ